jgi:hypothetical protein
MTTENLTAGATCTAHSVAGFAKHLTVSRSRVYELINSGTVIARKLGGRTLIFDADNQGFRASLPIAQPKAGVVR